MSGVKAGRDRFKDNRESREPGTQTPTNSAYVPGGNAAKELAGATNNVNSKQAVPYTDSICKIETVGSVHSELDIKDEGPIYAPGADHYTENNYGPNPQQNYIISPNSNMQPVNYYVMSNSAVTTNVLSQSGPIVQTAGPVVPGIPPIQQNYYVQGTPNHMIQNPQPNFLPAQQQQQQPPPQQQQLVFQQQDPRMMTQPFVNNAAYVPYVVATAQSQAGYMVTPGPVANHPQPRPQDPQVRFNQYRYIAPRQNSPHPNGTIVRGQQPVRCSYQKPGQSRSIRANVPQQRSTPNSRTASKKRQTGQAPAESGDQKTMSLIVLSDSDDEIEMIITEKGTSATTGRGKQTPQRTASQTKQKPTITSNVVVPPSKELIPPQILERMNQGGISITPIKTAPSVASTATANTQLVVVVNETGSHYALALPNGSKLILTPEQVAQIRASNGGKLIL